MIYRHHTENWTDRLGIQSACLQNFLHHTNPFLPLVFENYAIVAINFHVCRQSKVFINYHLKVALHTKGFTFYEPTSQYSDTNILWNCLYWSTWLYIIIAQWSKAMVLRTADPEFKENGCFYRARNPQKYKYQS